MPTPHPVCPECANGKHVNCGPALDELTDEIGPCMCDHPR